MKSRTLIFKSNQLEVKYQKMVQNNMLDFFKVFWKIGFLLSLIYLINGYIRNLDSLVLGQRYFILLYIVGTYFLILYKFPTYSQYCIQMTIMGIALIVSLNQYYEIYTICDGLFNKIQGATEFIIYISSLGLPKFKSDSIVFLVICIMKITISYLHSGIHLNQLLFFLTIISLCYQVYVREKQLRESFLLQVKEENIDLYLENLSKSPYLIFTYDEPLNKFEGSKSGNLEEIIGKNFEIGNIDQTKILKNVIREFWIHKMTLESYIFKLLQYLNDKDQNLKLVLNKDKDQYDVTLTIFQAKTLTFIITFDGIQEKVIKKMKQQYKPLYSSYNTLQNQHRKVLFQQNQLLNYIKSQFNYLNINQGRINLWKNVILQEKKKVLMSKLMLTNLEFLNRDCLKLRLVQFNLKSLMSHLQINYFKVKIDYEIEDREDLILYTDQNLFLTLFLNVLFSFKSQILVKISYQKKHNDSLILFEIQGLMGQQGLRNKLTLINNLLQYLGPHSNGSVMEEATIFTNIAAIDLLIYQNLKKIHERI